VLDYEWGKEKNGNKTNWELCEIRQEKNKRGKRDGKVGYKKYNKAWGGVNT